jgi:hypothetical protein
MLTRSRTAITLGLVVGVAAALSAGLPTPARADACTDGSFVLTGPKWLNGGYDYNITHGGCRPVKTPKAESLTVTTAGQHPERLRAAGHLTSVRRVHRTYHQLRRQYG